MMIEKHTHLMVGVLLALLVVSGCAADDYRGRPADNRYSRGGVSSDNPKGAFQGWQH